MHMRSALLLITFQKEIKFCKTDSNIKGLIKYFD